MEEKTYLKWYNKVGYGTGDIAGNVVYAFLSSFVMIYLTNTVGLNSGIVGTLIAVSKLFDGVTDIFFGTMIDHTKSKMGKARPWMFYGFFGCAVTLFGVFAIPTSLGKTAQYAWFFIAYTLLNAVFYTANVGAVEMFGGGAVAWRTIAFIYCIIGIITNTLAVFSVKELSDEELKDNSVAGEEDDKLSFKQIIKLLFSNKYFSMICVIYILQQLRASMVNVGIFFMTYVLLNENLFGVFSWANNIPLIIALAITPALVSKMKGMYKLNKYSYMLATVCRLMVAVAGYLGSVPLMLLFTVLTSLGEGPWQGDMSAVIAQCSEHTYLKSGKRIDGSMFSCTSLGVKLGGGIGIALSGWMLDISGYINLDNAVQPDSCINMMYFMYLWLPFIFDIIITVILSFLNVESANMKLKENMQNQ